jgi:hypothetical protein
MTSKSVFSKEIFFQRSKGMIIGITTRIYHLRDVIEVPEERNLENYEKKIEAGSVVRYLLARPSTSPLYLPRHFSEQPAKNKNLEQIQVN